MASIPIKEEPFTSITGDEDAHFKQQKALAQANDAKAEGNQLFVAGQFEDALSKYELALYFAQEMPSSAELRSICHSNRAVCFSKQGKYEEAIKEGTKALDLNTKNLKALIRRGEAHEKLKHFDESISDMKRILELDPSNSQAREAIQRLESLASQKQEKIKEEFIENMYQPQQHTSLDPMMMELNGDEDIASLGNEPMQKKPRLTSAVWKDFNRIVMGGIKVAICKHCNRRMSASSTSGTSHLRKHLIRCMRSHTLDDSQQAPDIKEDCGNAEVETFEFDVARSRNDFAQMVVFHELPFDFANFVGMKKFLKNLQPLFPLNSPKALEADCMKVYEDEKVKTYEKLEKVGSRISIASDMWTTSSQDRGYMALTAHYVDEDWVLQKRVLNFIQVDTPQNTEKLSESIMWCLIEWSIDGKLFSLSLDNCSITDCVAKTVCQRLNARRALLGDGKFFHVCCGANILNLIIQEGWKALGVCSDVSHPSVLDKVRESVKHVTNSTRKFSAIVNIIGVNTTRSLVLDSPMQRNSTYEMLEVALEYKEAFSYLAKHDKDFKIVFTSEEWAMVKDVADCLKTLHNATNLFSGTKYPTASLFFHQICEISLAISKWEASRDPFICEAARGMRTKFNDYWGVSHSGLAIASIIDPQYKCRLLDYYFPLFYGKDAAQNLIDGMNKSFENLYNEYASGESSSSSNQGHEAQRNEDVFMDVELSGFDRFIQQTSRNYVKKRDLEYYLDEAVLPRSKDFDILGWWKENGEKYPVLSKMARDILGTPVLSTGGKVLDEYRSSLSPATTQALFCGKDWLRDEYKDWKLKLDTGELLLNNVVDGYSD